MSWTRRASMMAALAALMMAGGCAKGKDAPPAQPATPTEAPAAEGQAEGQAEGSPAANPAPEEASAASKPAPDVTVRNAEGQAVALASTWQSGPAVLVFYRGHW